MIHMCRSLRKSSSPAKDEGNGMMCESCGFVDHSIIYPTKPPSYKCEKYGCIVNVTDICKGETNAEKQEQEKASQ